MPLPRLRALIRNLFDRGRADRELDQELRAYVDLLADEHERQESAGNALAAPVWQNCQVIDVQLVEHAPE